jgi:hypothetical protein
VIERETPDPPARTATESLLYNSPRRRHTTRNAHGGSGGGDDGSGTFALSQPATTVRKVIRGFSRRRAPGFYTAAATCILRTTHTGPRMCCPAAALDVLAENWGHLDSSAPRQCKLAEIVGGGSLTPAHSFLLPPTHTLYTHTRTVSRRYPAVLYPSAATIILLLHYVYECV